MMPRHRRPRRRDRDVRQSLGTVVHADAAAVVVIIARASEGRPADDAEEPSSAPPLLPLRRHVGERGTAKNAEVLSSTLPLPPPSSAAARG